MLLLSFIINDVTKAEHITTTFILQTEPNCYAYVGSLFLHSKDDIRSNTTIYLPETPMFVDCSEEENSKNTKVIHFEHIEPIPLHISDLNLAHQLEEIFDEIDYFKLREHIQRFLPWYSFLSVIVLIILSLCCCQLCCKCNLLSLCLARLAQIHIENGYRSNYNTDKFVHDVQAAKYFYPKTLARYLAGFGNTVIPDGR